MTVPAAPAMASVARPDRASLGVVRRAVREVGLAMIVGGVVVLLFVGYQLFGTGLSERHAQSSLSRAFQDAQRHGGAPAVAPATTGSDAPTVPGADRPAANRPTVGAGPVGDLSPSTPPGSAIEHLVIPRIGLDIYVVEGTAEEDLMKGPGHYVDTPFPGQRGNAAIAGHRTTYGAPFFRLDELTDGDRISVTNTKDRTFVFSVVRHLIVAPTGPSAAAVLADTPTAELTLTTCNPRFEASNRLVVVATLIGRPAPPAVASPTLAAPAIPTPAATGSSPRGARPAVAAASLGNGNGNGWPPGIAYGSAVVALWVATRLVVNRTRAWRRAGVLVAGMAACALPLWFCFENVVRLLPQSI